MSTSFLKKASAQGAKRLLANASETIDQLVTNDKVAAQIFEWLANLKLMHGVPFHYLIPDETMLPQESIRFFNLDINWVNALVDGAYSIGRNEVVDKDVTSLTNEAANAFYGQVHELSSQAARAKRAGHFGLETTDSPDPLEKVTGFLLRSQVVSGWKGVQVNAFDADHYPGNSAGNPVVMLPALRIEHLSDEVLLGIFEGDAFRLDIHEPSEGVHFGFDTDANDQLSKNLRNPKDGTAITTNSITNTELTKDGIFRSYQPPGDTTAAGSGGQVVNMYKMSALLYKQLNTANSGPAYKEPLPQIEVKGKPTPLSPPVAAGANPLVSSDFALQMVEGVGMVSFYNRS